MTRPTACCRASDAVRNPDPVIGVPGQVQSRNRRNARFDFRDARRMSHRILRHGFRPSVAESEERLGGDAHQPAQIRPHGFFRYIRVGRKATQHGFPLGHASLPFGRNPGTRHDRCSAPASGPEIRRRRAGAARLRSGSRRSRSRCRCAGWRPAIPPPGHRSAQSAAPPDWLRSRERSDRNRATRPPRIRSSARMCRDG